jgi:hypothetical protein
MSPNPQIKNYFLVTLFSIYSHFYACATSVDQDQPVHQGCLIRICAGCFFIGNNILNQNVNSVDPD